VTDNDDQIGKPPPTLIDRSFGLLELAAVLALAVMVVLVFTNVVMRYLFNSGIDISEELSRILLVWIIFIGAVIAFRERAHLGVDTVTRRLPRRARIACFVICELLMLFICSLIFDGSLTQAKLNLHNPAPVTGIPLSIAYMMSMFMSAAIGVMLAHTLYRLASGRLSEAELMQIKETEEAATLEAVEAPASNDRAAR
jgi:TRAP-type C4-dicarboxylate transport system permease small subunit